ncbi:DgsA anti-repressor MtfA [Pectobacteriaceae bacterium CE70]|uniref:Mlc titration factor A n=1 Tax=Serratia sp. (strain ATCC 39006) TaxID=104623 RepID=A0A2I5T701_SERS3|nr:MULTISPECIES: DgsA anti-repressor MtfA [Enterobacterales]WJV61099.1 DgsA anti-repressor MtfA [Pectobacteriaceae bacterium C52]WJV68561.1 DgsA anti-repressor MtfA [Pectobacteriaceae bacterium CE70]WJY12492.1 DgsA anti-repressor MtfA [Pectobacteriaceae bacterium C80]AUH00316.1 DgsA anti-repressor MtfA [Serratia sp. ATCC 39006]AUH04636.1 DgsA anti-repressor MtfA [Serratia sp. ATCC 39006]
MIKWQWKTHQPDPETLQQWQPALSIPLLTPLNDTEQQKLVTLARQFLRQKRLVPLQGLTLTELIEQRIALLFVLPIMELGIDWLDGFHEVLIHPAPFVVQDEWQDDIGLIHAGPLVQSGQSWEQGPIVLNWLEVQDSFDLSGFNLIIHEVAHKLDIRNGGMSNGVPAIPLRDVAPWEHHIHAVMTALEEEIELVGEDAASMDPYAATNPAECFAVLSEYFFSAPELLYERFPDVYQDFCAFYRQTPLARLQR